MKSIKKNFTLMLALAISIMFISTKPIYASAGPYLVINHVPVTGGAKPLLDKGTTLVPIRVISETLGAELDWNPDTEQIRIYTTGSSIEMTIGDPNVKVNGQAQTLAVAPTIDKGSTMLPIRFVGEALNCTVSWDNAKNTAYITSPNLAKAELPNFSHDPWGRKVKTSNLPKNAVIFPYIAEDVPNWAYENINMTHTALASSKGLMHLPKEFFYSGYNHAQVVDVLNRHFDTVLNLDYRTINKDEFKSYVNEVFSDKSFEKTGFSGAEWADTYVDYVVDNKITTTGSAIIMPEAFWVNNANDLIISAWVNLEVTSQDLVDSRLVFQDFGNFPTSGLRSGVFPSTQTNQKYEGLVQFRMFGNKIDYRTNSIVDQIHPQVNGFGGAYIQ
ncbi:MAG: copper amine oxidase N-terminal domain-containing protein [Epulopiscium sp.]|nr:copper amine oxidase N-terminal domain-containing protein [Candidatus Epulonipiscium sp.]